MTEEEERKYERERKRSKGERERERERDRERKIVIARLPRTNPFSVPCNLFSPPLNPSQRTTHSLKGGKRNDKSFISPFPRGEGEGRGVTPTADNPPPSFATNCFYLRPHPPST